MILIEAMAKREPQQHEVVFYKIAKITFEVIFVAPKTLIEISKSGTFLYKITYL